MLRLAALLLLAGVPFVALAAGPPSPEVEAVTRLYRDFAWEALIDEPRSGTPFVDQPASTLQKYLERGLVTLLAADRACVSRTKEICKLDFDPIWASQDPAASELKVTQGSKKGLVIVTFVYPGNGQRMRLEYTVIETPAGNRVHDIRYENARTLRGILSGSP